ncbi:hypothetical protein BDB01DRAFT_772620 [Pilobolus umbonatus]|nr:hypothetical protein BDB01DRAFT_772620 [Pilobolus umbonatus]
MTAIKNPYQKCTLENKYEPMNELSKNTTDCLNGLPELKLDPDLIQLIKACKVQEDKRLYEEGRLRKKEDYVYGILKDNGYFDEEVALHKLSHLHLPLLSHESIQY